MGNHSKDALSQHTNEDISKSQERAAILHSNLGQIGELPRHSSQGKSPRTQGEIQAPAIISNSGANNKYKNAAATISGSKPSTLHSTKQNLANLMQKKAMKQNNQHTMQHSNSNG